MGLLFSLGIDVGGNDIKYGALNKKGELLTDVKRTLKMPSRFSEGPDATVEVIREIRFQLERELRGKAHCIGLATPGPADANGVIGQSTNGGPAWCDVDIRKKTEDALRLPTKFINDADAAAGGEFLMNVSRNLERFGGDSGALFTVGTGFGGGIIYKGEVFVGKRGQAAEFGHIQLADPAGLIDYSKERPLCGCGRANCSETFTALGFLQRKVNEALKRNRDHPLNEVPNGGYERAKKLLGYAAQGDRMAIVLLGYQAKNLGVTMGNIMQILDFPWALIGGGITEASQDVRDMYLKEVRRGFRSRANKPQLDVVIEYAATGDNAGWIGAGDRARRAFMN